MFRKASFVPIAAVILAAAAPAPTTALGQNPAQRTVATSQSGGSGESAKSERKICKTFAASARRLDNKRLCMTKAQWRVFDESMED